MPEKHPSYWRIKAAVLAAQLTRTQAEQAVRQAEQQLRLLMQMSSLDPDVQYAMDDAEETLTPQESPEVQP
jgi:hypothetical protein